MPLLPWGEYKPDVADYEGQATKSILNVIPRGDGYGAMPSFASATLALPAACRGGFYAIESSSSSPSVQLFAATSLGLYRQNKTTLDWIPISRVAVCTISNASPAVITVTNTFVANDPVVFSTTGALPTGLTPGTVYYVSATGLSGAAFRVSATAGGALINTSSAGSGTHSVTSNYSPVSGNANWQFAQFGNLVFATQANEPLQVINLTSLTAFANCAGSPPQAAYISVVGRFIVLSGLLSNPYRIHWSGLNDTTQWTSGVNSSDFQDFPDGGIVRGVAGGEFGTVFQDQAMRRMSYIPGSALIFQIERITQDMGLFAPYSIIRSGSTTYFHSNKGFYKIDPGGAPVQIGRERVDRTFLSDLDKTNLQLFQGMADPRGTLIYWAYKSGAGATGLYDKILGYDTALDRFFPLSVSGEYLLGISQAGITLEGLDAISSSIDAMTLTLDAYATSVQPQIAQFDSTHKQGFFTGTNLEATLQSSEQGTDGQIIYTRGFRPITDAATVYGTVSSRMTQQAASAATAERLINSRTGMIDIRKEARYMRMTTRIPAGTTWTFSAGVEPNVTTAGTS